MFIFWNIEFNIYIIHVLSFAYKIIIKIIIF